MTSDSTALPEIHVLQPMGFDGIGPSQTCFNLAEAAGRQGAGMTIYGTRRTRLAPTRTRLVTPYGNLLSKVPYRYTSRHLIAACERQILAQVPQGALIHAWPALRAEVAETLKARGGRIAVELINILTLREKEILEAEMAREDFHYPHYVTPGKTRNQKRLLALADMVFVSNRHAAASLEGVLAADVPVVQTRYGAATRTPRRDYTKTGRTTGGRPVFVFVGRINLEKGVHLLLRAWKQAGLDAELHLYGAPDPAFAKRYADLLTTPGVQLKGFSRNIAQVYAEADGFVFLSLAEGGPQVTLEAAAQGLPMLVSPMGEGGLAEHDRTALVIDPHRTDAVAQALRDLTGDAALRERLGRAAFARSADFTWDVAARERVAGFAALA